MSKPKHTPGPWHKFEDKNGNVRVGSANHSIALLNNPLLFQFVEADARLIAAAPEMLEALKRIMQLAITRENDEAFDQVRAAIAKATGGAE